MVAVTILQGSAQLSKKWASNEASQNQGQKGLSLKISSLQNISIALKNYSITKSSSRWFQSIYYLPNLEFIWKFFEENKLKGSADVSATPSYDATGGSSPCSNTWQQRDGARTCPRGVEAAWRPAHSPANTWRGRSSTRAPARQHDAVCSVG